MRWKRNPDKSSRLEYTLAIRHAKLKGARCQTYVARVGEGGGGEADGGGEGEGTKSGVGRRGGG